MNWSVKQNKKGDKCIITCNPGIQFINLKIVYNTYNQDQDFKAKEVTLIVPSKFLKEESV